MQNTVRLIALFFLMAFLVLVGSCTYVMSRAAETAVTTYAQMEDRPDRASDIMANSLARKRTDRRSGGGVAWLILVVLGVLAFFGIRAYYFKNKAESSRQERLTVREGKRPGPVPATRYTTRPEAPPELPSYTETDQRYEV